MKAIHIQIIPHTQQRYETCGDWWWEEEEFLPGSPRSDVNTFIKQEVLHIRVSETGDWRANACIAYHELFEALACRQAGITQEQVDAFDMAWQPHDGYQEPGDDPQAPYFVQHQMALSPENCLMAMLGLGISEYLNRMEKVREVS